MEDNIKTVTQTNRKPTLPNSRNYVNVQEDKLSNKNMQEDRIYT